MTIQRNLKGSEGPEENPPVNHTTEFETDRELETAFKELTDAAPIQKLRNALSALLSDYWKR